MVVRPLFNRLLVRPLSSDEIKVLEGNDSKLVLDGTSSGTHMYAQAVEVGDEVTKTKNGEFLLLPKRVGNEVRIKGQDFKMITDRDILAVVAAE